jgi:hypothetical protein
MDGLKMDGLLEAETCSRPQIVHIIKLFELCLILLLLLLLLKNENINSDLLVRKIMRGCSVRGQTHLFFPYLSLLGEFL